MNEKYVYKLERGKHFSIDICHVSGCDYVPYMPRELDDWLIENMKDRYRFAGVSRYIDADKYDNVRIVFQDEEDLMGFKLRWE